MIWTDGSMYEGDWKHGIQHGHGRIVFPDGSFKEGQFENNVFKSATTQQTQANLISTHASTGFQVDLKNRQYASGGNPYQLQNYNPKSLKSSFKNTRSDDKAHDISLPNIHKGQDELANTNTESMWGSPKARMRTEPGRSDHHSNARSNQGNMMRAGHIAINEFLSRERQFVR